MPSAGRPRARGRQPAHVYKRRRLVVLSVAVLLVFGIGRVLSWSSDGSGGDDDKATQAAAESSPSAAESTKKPQGDKGDKGDKDCKGKAKFRGGDPAKGKRKACQDKPTPTPTPTPTPPAVPSGPCPDADVYVTPALPDPVAGRDVTIVLNLQTGTTEACTWRVSSDSVTVKVYAGADDVWSTRECPAAIPTQDVVVRRDAATPVTIVWPEAKRSDQYCTYRTAWAMPGTYGVAAAAFEGEPTDVTFELKTPVAAVVTQTAQPEGAATSGTPAEGGTQ